MLIAESGPSVLYGDGYRLYTDITLSEALLESNLEPLCPTRGDRAIVAVLSLSYRR